MRKRERKRKKMSKDQKTIMNNNKNQFFFIRDVPDSFVPFFDQPDAASSSVCGQFSPCSRAVDLLLPLHHLLVVLLSMMTRPFPPLHSFHRQPPHRCCSFPPPFSSRRHFRRHLSMPCCCYFCLIFHHHRSFPFLFLQNFDINLLLLPRSLLDLSI